MTGRLTDEAGGKKIAGGRQCTVVAHIPQEAGGYESPRRANHGFAMQGLMLITATIRAQNPTAPSQIDNIERIKVVQAQPPWGLWRKVSQVEPC